MNRSIFALILSTSLFAAPPAKKPAKKAKPEPVAEEPAPAPVAQAVPVKPRISRAEVMKASVMATYTAEQEIMLDGTKTTLLTCKILLAWHRDLAVRWELERVVRVKRHFGVAYDAVTTPVLKKFLPQTEAAMNEAEQTRDGFRNAVKTLADLKEKIEVEESPLPQS